MRSPSASRLPWRLLLSATDQSETLELKKDRCHLSGHGWREVYNRTKQRVLTNYDVNGALNMELPSRNLGWWLRYMVGDWVASGIHTPTQIGVTGVYKTFPARVQPIWPQLLAQKGVSSRQRHYRAVYLRRLQVNSWEIGCSVGAIASLTLNLDARNELRSVPQRWCCGLW
jgi:hypothetical protein